MRQVNKKKVSRDIYMVSREEIAESILRGSRSAMFQFETSRYAVEVSLYIDNTTMIHIWDIEKDCPACNKSNVEDFIADSCGLWSEVSHTIDFENYERKHCLAI